MLLDEVEYSRMRCAFPKHRQCTAAVRRSNGTENHFKPFPGERLGMTQRRKTTMPVHFNYGPENSFNKKF